MTRKTGEPDPKGAGGAVSPEEVRGRSEDAEETARRAEEDAARAENEATLSAGPTKTRTVDGVVSTREMEQRS